RRRPKQPLSKDSRERFQARRKTARANAVSRERTADAMSENGKTNTPQPGEGMNREQLVQAHFRAYGDLTWKRHLEPEFDQHGSDANFMWRYRLSWNLYNEKNNWPSWQINVANVSNDELKAEIAMCHEEIAAIDSQRSPHERVYAQSAFQAILN